MDVADLSEMAQAAGPCQHALGMRANVIAEAVSCTASTTVAAAERIVVAIMNKVQI